MLFFAIRQTPPPIALDMKILEVGRYAAPAYAGMILAEQGHAVVKWVMPHEPILSLGHGEEIWRWINEGKCMEDIAGRRMEEAQGFDIILTNLRTAKTAEIAKATGATVVKLIPVGVERSFDVVAQAQAWGDFVPWVPFWIGDTVAGLWMAFKALAAPKGSACEIQHPAALAKLIECELLPVNAKRMTDRTPWESSDNYGMSEIAATVKYNNETISEPKRDIQWRRANLKHENGRIII